MVIGLDEALATADRAPDTNLDRLGFGNVVGALAALAAEVRRHRPVMPRSQRGVRVDHAVELLDLGDGAHRLVALCGGLRPVDEPGQLDDLDVFNPTGEHACVTCTRRLPAPLRPPPVRHEPRVRHPDPLAAYGLSATATGGVQITDPAGELLDDEPAGYWLAEAVRIARAHARSATVAAM